MFIILFLLNLKSMKLWGKLKREVKWLKLEYGIITPIIMGLFRFLQFFPLQYLIGNRTDHYYKDLANQRNPLLKNKTVRKKSKSIDKLILFYLVLEISAPFLTFDYISIYFLISRIIPDYLMFCYAFGYLSVIYLTKILLFLRLIDIIQVNVNMVLFDGLRFRDNRMAKFSRTIIMLVWNYLELILIFGFFYLVNWRDLYNCHSISDAYYFSAISQLTIGYGDITPRHNLRFLAVFHGVIGTLFLILIVSKVVSLLPNVKSIGDDNNWKKRRRIYKRRSNDNRRDRNKNI